MQQKQESSDEVKNGIDKSFFLNEIQNDDFCLLFLKLLPFCCNLNRNLEKRIKYNIINGCKYVVKVLKLKD